MTTAWSLTDRQSYTTTSAATAQHVSVPREDLHAAVHTSVEERMPCEGTSMDDSGGNDLVNAHANWALQPLLRLLHAGLQAVDPEGTCLPRRWQRIPTACAPHHRDGLHLRTLA
jgi:hypothetical protein